MGYMRHHAIVVTTYTDDHARLALGKALELGMSCSDVVASPVNGYLSFFVAPDGSKEGWARSKEGDDNGVTKVIRHSDEIASGDDYDGPALAEEKL